MQKIVPYLWFDGKAEEALNFYVSVFKNTKVIHSRKISPPGSQKEMFTGTFEIEGQQLMVLDGGPMFTFSPAISLFVNCKDQLEVDDLWNKLSAGGEAQRCGWLKDKFGISWQIIPDSLGRLLNDPDSSRSSRVMQALLKMDKIIIEDLEKAWAG